MNKTEQIKHTIRLSPRLAAVAAFVEPGARAADIGTDHGYIPMFLLQEGICPKVLAMDVRQGPLERARAHRDLLPEELQKRMELRISDGLTALKPGEADTVIIAGMGGSLILSILEKGRCLWPSVRHWILSPQSDLGGVRHFLCGNGFAIEQENMVKDQGKYYTVLSVRQGECSYEREADYIYGRCLIQSRNPVLSEYLDREERRLREILKHLDGEKTPTDKGIQARQSVWNQWNRIKEVQDAMQ